MSSKWETTTDTDAKSFFSVAANLANLTNHASLSAIQLANTNYTVKQTNLYEPFCHVFQLSIIKLPPMQQMVVGGLAQRHHHRCTSARFFACRLILHVTSKLRQQLIIQVLLFKRHWHSHDQHFFLRQLLQNLQQHNSPAAEAPDFGAAVFPTCMVLNRSVEWLQWYQKVVNSFDSQLFCLHKVTLSELFTHRCICHQ